MIEINSKYKVEDVWVDGRMRLGLRLCDGCRVYIIFCCCGCCCDGLPIRQPRSSCMWSRLGNWTCRRMIGFAMGPNAVPCAQRPFHQSAQLVSSRPLFVSVFLDCLPPQNRNWMMRCHRLFALVWISLLPYCCCWNSYSMLCLSQNCFDSHSH